MHATRIDLPLSSRKILIEMLNQSLADAIDLSLQSKQAHWNVKGPDFIALHKLFDEVYDAAVEFVDLIAERIAALGGVAEGALETVGKRTRLPKYPPTISAGRDHVDALATALAIFGKFTRQGIDQADELRDKNTADLYTEVSRDCDKLLWFVEAHVQADK